MITSQILIPVDTNSFVSAQEFFIGLSAFFVVIVALICMYELWGQS